MLYFVGAKDSAVAKIDRPYQDLRRKNKVAKHIVQSGETLGKIAQQYLGSSSKYMEIVNANDIADPNRVAVGTELIIPQTVIPEAVTNKASSDAENAVQLTLEQLQAILNTSDSEKAERYLAGLNECFDRYQINTSLRIAHFMAQVCHESGNFKFTSENLNYSAKALRGVFGKYFPSDDMADEYARQPEKIANRVYASRMGNGDEQSGEGWAYRGRGLIQLTGKDNYQNFSESCDVDVIANPDLVAQDPALCVSAAAWFWDSRSLNRYADDDDIKTVTKRINGGYNGLEDRQEKLDNAKNVLGIA